MWSVCVLQDKGEAACSNTRLPSAINHQPGRQERCCWTHPSSSVQVSPGVSVLTLQQDRDADVRRQTEKPQPQLKGSVQVPPRFPAIF